MKINSASNVWTLIQDTFSNIGEVTIYIIRWHYVTQNAKVPKLMEAVN